MTRNKNAEFRRVCVGGRRMLTAGLPCRAFRYHPGSHHLCHHVIQAELEHAAHRGAQQCVSSIAKTVCIDNYKGQGEATQQQLRVAALGRLLLLPLPLVRHLQQLEVGRGGRLVLENVVCWWWGGWGEGL